MSEKKKILLLYKMARLVSYKPTDENRYSTFRNESTVHPSISSYNDSDLFKRVELVKKTRNIKIKKSKRSKCFTWTFLYKLCTCCCCCCGKRRCCCHYNKDDSINDDYGIDIKSISCTSDDIQLNEINSNSLKSEKTKSKTKSSNKYWNWNDSLKSNSDRFLETLEYDLDGDRSLKKKSNRTSSKIPLYSKGKRFC